MTTANLAPALGGGATGSILDGIERALYTQNARYERRAVYDHARWRDPAD
jgi:hypothetical protein